MSTTQRLSSMRPGSTTSTARTCASPSSRPVQRDRLQDCNGLLGQDEFLPRGLSGNSAARSSRRARASEGRGRSGSSRTRRMPRSAAMPASPSPSASAPASITRPTTAIFTRAGGSTSRAEAAMLAWSEGHHHHHHRHRHHHQHLRRQDRQHRGRLLGLAATICPWRCRFSA